MKRKTPPVYPVREEVDFPGTRANLAALRRALRGWKCCGAPSLCGGGCQDDALSAALAQAAHALEDHLTRRGSAPEGEQSE